MIDETRSDDELRAAAIVVFLTSTCRLFAVYRLSASTWRVLGAWYPLGIYCRLLPFVRDLLASYWRLLTSVGIYWRVLTSAGVFGIY